MATLDEDQKRTDLALKRYDAILRYLSYENNVYWVRGQFFLLANTALAAFVLNQIPISASPAPTWNRLGVSAIASIAGLVLTWLWRSALTTGEHWIQHWMEILTDLEAEAFGEIRVFREWKFRSPPPGPQRSHSAKKMAHWLANLFSAIWSFALLYVVFLGWAKLIGWTPAISN
jgi:hypothetical protein